MLEKFLALKALKGGSGAGSGGDPVLPPGVGIYYIGTASSTFVPDFESSASGALS